MLKNDRLNECRSLIQDMRIRQLVEKQISANPATHAQSRQFALPTAKTAVLSLSAVFLACLGLFLQPGEPTDEETVKPRHPKLGTARTLSPAELYERSLPAVVKIETATGSGSGFFVSADGLVATNYHVIERDNAATVELHDGRVLRVIGVVACNRFCDLAVLKISGRGYSHLEMSSELPGVGIPAFAIGSPQGLENTLTDGLISAIREHPRPNLNAATFTLAEAAMQTDGVTYVQTSAPISPGSSGGPLLDETGKVVGVTTSYRKDGQNLNFAVSAAHLKDLLRYQEPPTPLAATNGRSSSRAAENNRRSALAALNQVTFLLNNNRPEEALEILEQCREHVVESSYWAVKGRALVQNGKRQLGIIALNKAIQFDSGEQEAYEWLCVAYTAANYNRMVVETCNRFLRNNAGNAWVYNELGSANFRLKRFAEASRWHRAALESDPRNANAFNGLGHVFYALNFYEAAIPEFERALNNDPDHLMALWGKASACRRLGRHREAVGLLERVLRLDVLEGDLKRSVEQEIQESRWYTRR